MVICSNCGEENRKKAMYCKKCGERLQVIMYVKRKEPWGIVHIGVLLLSVLLLITSFGLIMGGTSLKSIQDIMTDDEGFIMSNTRQLQVSSYAIVVEDMDFDIDPIALRWFETRGGFLRFKIVTTSNNPEKEVFVGIARYEDAYGYINSIEYHEIANFDLGWKNFGSGTSQIKYVLHPGETPASPPTIHSYWIIHGTQTGSQSLRWEPEAGRYYLVMMNADGSSGIDADVKIGVEIPFFAGIGNILLAAGVLIGFIGALILYFTIRSSKS
jgi:hypothetical protein